MNKINCIESSCEVTLFRIIRTNFEKNLFYVTIGAECWSPQKCVTFKVGRLITQSIKNRKLKYRIHELPAHKHITVIRSYQINEFLIPQKIDGRVRVDNCLKSNLFSTSSSWQFIHQSSLLRRGIGRGLGRGSTWRIYEHSKGRWERTCDLK